MYVCMYILRLYAYCMFSLKIHEYICVKYLYLSAVCNVILNVAKPSLPLSRSICRERAGGLERPPGPHCAAEETSQGFDDVGMKWQKLLVSRKHKD